jgi:hypothetical protein
MLNPLIVKIVTGNLILPYGFKLPFIDETSVTGYAINFAHHLLQDYIVVFGFICADSVYAIIVINIYCVYDVIGQMLDELNEMINVEKSKKVQDHQKIREKLISIAKTHQDLLRFVTLYLF